jgi:outer membrane protein TolC
VAQACASISEERVAVASANANLAAGIAGYLTNFGHAPGALKLPRIPKLPRSLANPLAEAREINPSILAAAHAEPASRFNIAIAKGDLLPIADVDVSATFADHPSSNVETSRITQFQGVFTVPL